MDSQSMAREEAGRRTDTQRTRVGRTYRLSHILRLGCLQLLQPAPFLHLGKLLLSHLRLQLLVCHGCSGGLRLLLRLLHLRHRRLVLGIPHGGLRLGGLCLRSDELQPPLLFERLPLALSCLGIRFPASLLCRFRRQVGNDALLPQQVLLRLGSALALQRLLLLQPSSLTLRLRFVSSGLGGGCGGCSCGGFSLGLASVGLDQETSL